MVANEALVSGLECNFALCVVFHSIVQLLETSAAEKPIIMESGRLDGANGSAPYETVTTAHISQTIIDYPPMPVPTTFSLVPPHGQVGVVPTALAPSNIRLVANDSQDSVDPRAPVSAFVPAGALSSGQCTDSSGNANATSSCQRRVQFLVYTSVLFFQQVQETATTGAGGSTNTGGTNAGGTGTGSAVTNVAGATRVLANSLIIAIKLGNLDRVQLVEPVVLTFTPLSGMVCKAMACCSLFNLLANENKFQIFLQI